MCPRAAQYKLTGHGLDNHDLEDTTSTRIGLKRKETPFRLVQKKIQIVLLDRTALIYFLVLQLRMSSSKGSTKMKLGADS